MSYVGIKSIKSIKKQKYRIIETLINNSCVSKITGPFHFSVYLARFFLLAAADDVDPRGFEWGPGVSLAAIQS